MESRSQNPEREFGRYLRGLEPGQEDRLLDHLLSRMTPDEIEPVELVTAAEFIDPAEKLLVKGDAIVGVSCGFPSIDAFTRGFGPGDMIVVYGWTSHGKSQVMQNCTYQMARANVPVLYVGLEMTNAQNNTRFMDIADSYQHDYSALGVILYPAKNDIKLDTIERTIEEAVKQGAKLVIIDQLQQLTRSVDNRTNETSLISAEVKRMAIKYQVPVVLIAHVNRTGDQRKEPGLSELKDSSSIAQDADICISVWRDTDDVLPGYAEVVVRCQKNRNRGHLGDYARLAVKAEVTLVDPLQPPLRPQVAWLS